MIAKIFVTANEQGKLVVEQESAWNDSETRDYPGLLEGMLNEEYDDLADISSSVEQIVLDSKSDANIISEEIIKTKVFSYETGEQF